MAHTPQFTRMETEAQPWEGVCQENKTKPRTAKFMGLPSLGVPSGMRLSQDRVGI